MGWLSNISLRLVVIIVGVIVLIAAVGLFVRSCDKRRSLAAQTRLEHAQSEAAANSAADAVNTVARSGEAAAASEGLGRDNERDIRKAPGAGDRVNTGVDVAGRRALCQRKAYRDDPKCKVFRQ